MDLFQAFILGVVEGVTEFLPVSSTGHLILAGHLLRIPPTEFFKTFEIAIQLGAILAVVVLYWKRFLLDFEVLKRVAAAFLPTAVIGFVLYKLIKKFLLGNAFVVVAALFIGGLLLIVFEKWHQEKDSAQDDLKLIPYKTAILIGLFQTLAVIPGVSRSAATIIGGLLLGLKRKTIVEFSFLLAVPTMLAATILDLLKSHATITSADLSALGIGFVTSFVIALLSIKFLLNYIQRHNFVAFGIYRMVAAFVFWLIILKV